jgi:hypothetical protein
MNAQRWRRSKGWAGRLQTDDSAAKAPLLAATSRFDVVANVETAVIPLPRRFVRVPTVVSHGWKHRPGDVCGDDFPWRDRLRGATGWVARSAGWRDRLGGATVDEPGWRDRRRAEMTGPATGGVGATGDGLGGDTTGDGLGRHDR